MAEKIRTDKRDGFSDGLVPLEPLDLSKVDTIDELLTAMSKTAFSGRKLGEAADVLYNMAADPDCLVVMTLSGAMTPAQMGLIITDFIDKEIVNAIVSTGALMAHGFIQGAGLTHFKYDPKMSDDELCSNGYNRIHDILEPETNFDVIEDMVSFVCKPLPRVISRRAEIAPLNR